MQESKFLKDLDLRNDDEKDLDFRSVFNIPTHGLSNPVLIFVFSLRKKKQNLLKINNLTN